MALLIPPGSCLETLTANLFTSAAEKCYDQWGNRLPLHGCEGPCGQRGKKFSFCSGHPGEWMLKNNKGCGFQCSTFLSVRISLFHHIYNPCAKDTQENIIRSACYTYQHSALRKVLETSLSSLLCPGKAKKHVVLWL